MSLIPSSEAEGFLDELKKHDPNAANILDWDDEKYFDDKKYTTNSHLKILRKGGPQHLKAYLKFGQETKKAFEFGSALHCLILEPDMFEARYFAIDDTEKCIEIGGARPRTTKVYKEWHEEIMINNANRTVLSLEDMTTLEAMEKKLKSLPAVMQLFQNTRNEIVYQKTINGVKCKCKGDAVKSTQYCADLKSMSDAATEDNFKKALYKYGYDQQGAFYKDILGVDTFYFVAIEKKYPYTVGVFELSEDTYQTGKEKYEYALEQFKHHFVKHEKEIDGHFVKALI